MRHFYESYHQRRLRSRIGNYNHHQHHTHHNHPAHTHHYASYLLHHHHLPQARTTLSCLVQNRQWPEVVRRSQTHPAEVLFQDAVAGNTPLHVACRMDPPIEVIQALKATSRMQNWDGATPLHIAASHRCSARALTTLLEVSAETAAAKPAAASAAARTENNRLLKSGSKGDNEDVDEDENVSVLSTLSRSGRAPIHYACSSFRGLELEAFKVLFEATIKDGNLRLQTTKDLDQQQQNGSGLDYWLGEDEEDEDESNSDENEDDMVQEFRKEEEVMRMIMDNEEYCDYDDDGVAEQEQRQRAGSETTTCHQVVVVNVLGLKDATGQTPLGLLFRRYRERVRHVINRIDRIHDAASAAAQRDALRGNRNSSSNGNVPGSERLRRASMVASLTVQGELGELWGKARWIVARLTQERLEREQDWKNYPGPMTRVSTLETAAETSPQAVAAAQEAADWAAEQFQSSFSPRDEHSDFYVPVPTMNVMDKKMSEKSHGAASTTPSRKFRIVHASVGLTGYGCPPEMIRLAISVHPHQVYEMDEDGNLPIHIAAMASSHLASAEDANNSNGNSAFSDYLAAASFADSGGAAGGGGDDHSVLSDAMNSFFSSATISQTTNPFDKVIKILLHHYPQAAQIPQGKFPGKLPLVLAMEQQEEQQSNGGGMVIRGGGGGNRRASWEDGIRTLMYAHPAALHSNNRKHAITQALYPNVLALIAEDYVMTSRLPFRLCSGTLTLSASSSSLSRQPHQQRHSSRSSSTSKLLRREACTRTTVFELLRTKPEWLGNNNDE